jgi:EAL domain-containing protein (putative c-di-GMP-specific phosphodiesterase class I)
LPHAAERGELRLHYQPKVALGSGRITGVEALVRWQHPRLGLLGPDRFIALAEESGAIVAIGRWVLRSACAQASIWRREHGLDLRMAVNLSRRQFADRTLRTDIAAALDEAGLDPGQLELEITESTVMHRAEHAAAQMRELRAMGVHLAMDDFGTGYSSLGFLKRFPISNVKIDRSFVRDLPHNGDDAAITRAVIGMAHSLHLTVTAEGVENREQVEFLRRERCEEYQGYFCSPPVPESELLRLVAARAAPN